MGHLRRNGAIFCMRAILALGLLIALAACSGDPKSFGITGPGTHPVPAAAAKHKLPT
jgi:hypothetical protein